MEPTSPPSSKTQLQGWLQKKGGMMKTWHNRYFRLSDKMLFQFNREDDPRASASYFLADSNYRVVEQPFNPEETDKYYFDLTPGNKGDSGAGETVSLCAGSDADRQRWIKAIRYALFADKGGAIFGQSLKETMRYSHKHGRKIPIIVEKCVGFLYANGLQVEGIFRLPGRTTVIRDLKEKFDCGETVNFDMLEPDVNSVASLLKMFLRELPESLIPCNLYQKYMNHALRFIDAKKDEEARHQCVLELADAMSELPKDNYTILKYLCKFVHDVAKYSDVNKMTVDNLATVFGPNIIRHMDDNPELLMVTADLTQKLAYMFINYYDIVFTFDYREDGNVPEADLLRMSTMDANPVLTPQTAVTKPSAPTSLDELASLDLQFADEVFDQLSQSPGHSQLPPTSPLKFKDNYFQSGTGDKISFNSNDTLTNNIINRPIPPKRRSKVVRGRRISDRRPGSHSDTEKAKTPEDPSKTLTDSIKEALAKKPEIDVFHTNGTSEDKSQAADAKVQPSVDHLQMQIEALKLELVNTKTRYEARVKNLVTELQKQRDAYEKKIASTEEMFASVNNCLTKEKKDRAEAVERVVDLQAQLHKYQMRYGKL